MASKKNVTFSDIAKYTNFSKTTISRYFNNPDSLTLENQEIIVKGRHDPCVAVRAVPVVESCVNVALLSQLIEQTQLF